jgi:arylsulfatase A-like enzyme
MRVLTRSVCLFFITILLFSCNEPSKNEKAAAGSPNIVFIMSDDHAYQAISSYDGRLNQTPNIDRLANEGMRFTRSFVTNSICGPSRAVMLTGKYSHINGHIDNQVAFDGGQQTFPKLLQKAGYQTAIVGKWHLKSEPTGFDYYNILPGQGHYYNPDFIENGERKRITGYVTDLTTDFAIKWLDERDTEKPFCLLVHHKAPHRNWMPAPEYLNKYDEVDFPLPETFFDDYSTRSASAREQELSIEKDMQMAYDMKVPQLFHKTQPEARQASDANEWNLIANRMNEEQRAAWNKAYQPKNDELIKAELSGDDLTVWKYQRYMQDYLSCIASVDDNVGRLMDYLEAQGLAENTIIVYTSDQGFYLGEHGWFDKRFMYEQSLRMPLIVRFPKEINPAVNAEDMVLNLDFAPTFLDYAGVDIPADMQGESMRKVLSSETPDDWREAVYYRYYEYPAVHGVKRHYGIRTDRYKLIHFYYDLDEWEFYDLQEDPREVNNLYNDPAYADLIQNLKKQLAALQEKYEDTEGDKYMPQPDVEVDHLAKGASVSLLNPYHQKYPGGGSNGLTNGIRGADQGFLYSKYDAWQGFEGENLEAVIDLKEPMTVNSISCGFLQRNNAWIFLPSQITIFTSTDGRQFKKLKEFKNSVPQKFSPDKRAEYSVALENETIRFVKVVAVTIGNCPEWHSGAGGKAWIFADEIVVK